MREKYPKIPITPQPEAYVETSFIQSPFIQIKSSDKILVQMQYPLLHMQHAESGCYVREEVFHMLQKAALLLPDGYRLVIWDAWRPFALQQELYDVYSTQIIHDFHLENHSKEEQDQVIQKFVSIPIYDRNLPPAHTTGGAVDVTIVDEDGKELDFGTAFDAFTSLTNTDAFEDTDNEVVKQNRRMLYHIMCSVGFTNLPSEWWHYEYGDKIYAYYKNKPAIYDGKFTIEELEIKE